MRHHAVDCLMLFNQSQAANRAINEPTPEPETPEWLPEGASANDFTSGTYYIDGEAVELSEYYVENISWKSWDGTFPEGGLTGPSDGSVQYGPVLSTAAAADFLGGATVVVNYELGTDYGLFMGWQSFDEWVGERWIYINHMSGTPKIRAGDFNDLNLVEITPVSSGEHRVAITMDHATGHIAVSLDGAAAVTAEAGPASVAYTHIMWALQGDYVLKRLIFMPVQDDAALPALSAL